LTGARLTMTDDADGLTRLCALDDVAEDEPFRAQVDGEGYAVFQVEDRIFVTADLCTHGPGCLSDGYVDGFQIECPFHQGRFDLRTGQPTAPPCEIPLRIWVPIIRQGAVYINLAGEHPP
jgi:nitrite reductase/ring-hydroxylating ferredoxin subunit